VQHINLGILATEHIVDLVKHILSNTNFASFIDSIHHLMETVNITDIIIIISTIELDLDSMISHTVELVHIEMLQHIIELAIIVVIRLAIELFAKEHHHLVMETQSD
jgi:hypothetical protein